MKLKCTITKTSLIKQLPVFMVVQLSLKQGNNINFNQLNRVQKFRTQLSLNTSRPVFHNNQFTFQLIKQNKSLQQQQQQQKSLQSLQSLVYNIKFGLMLIQCDKYGKIKQQNYQSATLLGTSSMNLSIKRLKQIGIKGEIKYLDLINQKNKNVYGQFQVKMVVYENNMVRNKDVQLLEINNRGNEEDDYGDGKNNNKNNNINNNNNVNNNDIKFAPLIQWMLFDQNCHDPLRQQNCITALQNQSNILFNQLHQFKHHQQHFESLLSQLSQDQLQLKQQLQLLQKLNNKISQKLYQKQNIQSLKLQIDLLKSTREGKSLLIEKLEYFQDRIYKEEELYEENIKKYQEIKPEIQKKIAQSQVKEMKLKAKQQQQFMIKNNQEILKNYQNILYQYRSNQQVIQSLVKMSQKSSNNQYTRQQAQLFLSQVKYQIKLQQMNIKTNHHKQIQQEQQKLLKKIQYQMQNVQLSNNQYNNSQYGKSGGFYNNNMEAIKQGEDLVYQIKLDSLNQEIQKIKQKIMKNKNKGSFY